MSQPSVNRPNQIYAPQNAPGLQGSRPVTVLDGPSYPYGPILNANNSNFGGSRVIGGSRVNGSVISNTYGPPGVRVINGGPVGSNVYTNTQSVISHPSTIRK